IPVWSMEHPPADAVEWIGLYARGTPADGAAIAQAGDSMHVCLRQEDSPIAKRLEIWGFKRDPDVLDTWFSSALWPMSTMGWPDPAAAGPEFAGMLEAFNPSS